MVQGPITLILTSLKVAPTHVERMITLQYRDQSLKRTVIHLQFTSWPELYGTGTGWGGAGGTTWWSCSSWGGWVPVGPALNCWWGTSGLQAQHGKGLWGSGDLSWGGC